MSASSTADVAAKIERFVRDHFRVGQQDTRFSRSAALFDLGYVDSVGVIELLAFVEQQFRVRIPDDTLLSDEFTTIDGMAAVISRIANDHTTRTAQLP